MRALRRWLAVLAATTLAVLLAPVAAAADDPPDIVGDTVDQAEGALLAWHQKVIIVWTPDLKQPPPSVSPDSVLVASTKALPAPDADHPRVEVDLGTAPPDLTGLTETAVEARLNPLDMKADILPDGRQPHWTVSVQRPPAGHGRSWARRGTRSPRARPNSTWP
jgi:hypothetical protein